MVKSRDMERSCSRGMDRQADRAREQMKEREREGGCEGGSARHTERKSERDGGGRAVGAACDGDEEVSHMQCALKMPREERTAGILAQQNQTKSALLSLCCANTTYNIRQHKDKCDRELL